MIARQGGAWLSGSIYASPALAVPGAAVLLLGRTDSGRLAGQSIAQGGGCRADAGDRLSDMRERTRALSSHEIDHDAGGAVSPGVCAPILTSGSAVGIVRNRIMVARAMRPKIARSASLSRDAVSGARARIRLSARGQRSTSAWAATANQSQRN